MVVIVDYGMSNLRTLEYKLRKEDIDAVVSGDCQTIKQASCLILPGVGHFAKGMENLEKNGLVNVLTDRVMEHKVPIFGICLGMQLFCEFSEEGDAQGLGWIEGSTRKFDFSDLSNPLPIPHVGWNVLKEAIPHPVLDEVEPEQRFYFTHSYHFCCKNPTEVAATSHYGFDFTACVAKNNIFGTQFHPEKSHRRGVTLLLKFIQGNQEQGKS